jgi:hypothetical protein
MNAAIAALRADVQASASQIQTVIAQKADAYAAREDDAVSAVLANAGSSAPSRKDVAARLQADYRTEYAQLRSGAEGDMAAYRRALLDQEQRDYATFVTAVQNRTQQAYFNRSTELRESQSTLMLDLARRDAPQRLVLRAKLQTLALNDQTRAQIERRLAALQASEDRVLQKQRARDASTLDAYRSTLLAQASRDIAHMSAQLQSRTQANLAARRDVLAAQRAQRGSLPIDRGAAIPQPRTQDLRSTVAALRAQGAGTFRTQAQAAIDAYTAARDDVSARFADLRDRDAAALHATLAAIAALEQDRAALAARLK